MAGTTLFALLAGLYYWWPKITKRKPNETFGVITFVVAFISFNILYFPYFFLIDMPRRIYTYTIASGFASANLTATIGAYIFGPAAALAVLNLILSLRKPALPDANPWNAQELEWTQNYRGSTATQTANSSEKAVDTADDPPEETREDHWYWCRDGTCKTAEKPVDNPNKNDYPNNAMEDKN
jgi:heme/copper-type cytochrome/quinol oxidase subunit 1